MARRNRRKLGARSLFPRWPGSACLSHRRYQAHRQSEEMDGLDAGPSTTRWLDRTNEDRSATSARLVAELRHAQGAGSISGGHRRSARDPGDGEVFRLSGPALEREAAETLGHLPLA